MKNAFGGLLHTHRHYTHSWIHRTLVDLLAIQKEIHTGIFAVMDGTTAGNGPGPRTMYPVVKNVMLASRDQVAIDAVAAKMMGFDPMSLEYINVAHSDGLGVGDPRDIEIVGDDVSKESWGFHVGDNLASLGVPRTHFGVGTAGLLRSQAAAGGDVIGLDHRIALADGWALVGERAVQGNLDPSLLLGPFEAVADAAAWILDQAAGRQATSSTSATA
jgi:hypothetical protein